MRVIRTDHDLSDVAASGDPALSAMVEARVADTAEHADHFSEVVFFVVVEPGDELPEVGRALGFPPLINRFDDTPFGHPDFTPSWDVSEEHPGYHELVFVLSQDGAGVTLFITKAEGVPPELLEMCRVHVGV